MYEALVHHWWWDGMYMDTISFAKNCPVGAVVMGGGRKLCPPLNLIPVARPFRNLGMDVMELPWTQAGN